jgi:Tol biopolymer transport system component
MTRCFTCVTLALLLLWAPARAQDLEVELQRAIQQETVSGNLKAAIDAYRRIADKAGANRQLAARALVRLADAHRKLGDAEARQIYERLVKDFADQKEIVTEARARLAALKAPVAAGTGTVARQVWTEAADAMGMVSADGRLLSFTDWSTGDLMLRDLVAGTSRRLTNTGGWAASGDYAEFSVLSPDGREVAYAWYRARNNPPNSYYDARVISTASGDGAKPRVILQSDDLRWVMPLAWTPDGKAIVLYRETAAKKELGIVPLPGGEFRALAELRFSPQRAAISPDGRFIAYDTSTGPGSASPRDIFLVSIDGKTRHVLDAHPANDQMPMWTPDGTRVLFLSSRTGNVSLWSLPVDNGKAAGAAELVKQDVGAFYPLGMTRSGAILYFVGGDRFNTRLAQFDADLKLVSGPTAVTESFVNYNLGASWSPDGGTIAYYGFQGRESQGASVIFRDVATGRERDVPTKLVVQRGASGHIVWFPDGKSVLLAANDMPNDGLAYYRMDVAAGTLELLHRTARRGPGINAPTLTRDGKAIVYIDFDTRSNNRALRLLDLATQEQKVVHPGPVLSMSLSPDGERVALVVSPAADASLTEIQVMPLRGGTAQRIYATQWLDNSRISTLTWSPDGRHVLFFKPENGTQGGTPTTELFLWRLRADGSGAPEKTGLSGRGQLKSPNFHPTSRQLLYSSRELTDSAVWILENFLPPAKRGS